MIGLTAQDNWLLAIRDTLPDAVKAIVERLAELEAERAKLDALMRAYGELIAVAERHKDAEVVERLLEEDFTDSGRW
jgi:DNA-binding SARP family transcriptional activator